MELKSIIIPIFAVIFIFYGLSTIDTDANPIVALEEINFTTNDTGFEFANDPVNDFGLTAYHFENTTFPIPTANYVWNDTHITLYTNGTNVCYPNVTANCNYYTTYSYEKSATVWGLDLSWIGILVIIGVGLIIVGKLGGFI